MKKIIIPAIIFFYLCTSFGPPNRNLFKDDPPCYEGCLLAERAIEYHQGSRASQELFDQSLDSCPSFAYSYYEKGVPYAKRGLMHLSMQMMDEAVRYAPKEYLSHRAWYHHIFTGNSEAAIADIDTLDALIDYDLGPCGNGEYQLEMIRALAYKALGERDTALSLMEEHLYAKGSDPLSYDFVHLGVLYLESGELDKAMSAFDEQSKVYEWSSNEYYRAMTYDAMGESKKALTHMELARKRYLEGSTMDNPYMHRADRIYLSDIDLEISRLKTSSRI